MKSIRGKVAAITGAASGIGRATAARFAREGCQVALCDVDEAGLEATAAACREHHVAVSASRVDVADRAKVHAWADAVVREHGAVHVVVNNAGVSLGATVEDTSYEDFHWIMGINFWGVVHGTQAFLPHLRAAGEGHLVNVSSVLGLIGVPTQAAYAAAKFAVKGFSEALRQELEIDGARIGVTVVHPGGVKTAIVRNARLRHREGWIDKDSAAQFEKAFSTTPERAAEQILRAVLGNRRRLLIGRDAMVIDLMQRLFPEQYQRFVVSRALRLARRRRS